jgi:hypothetical protein
MTIQNIQPRDTALTAAEHVFSIQALKGDHTRNDVCFDGLNAVLLAIALLGDEWSVSIRAPNEHLYNSDQLGALLFAYAWFSSTQKLGLARNMLDSLPRHHNVKATLGAGAAFRGPRQAAAGTRHAKSGFQK